MFFILNSWTKNVFKIILAALLIKMIIYDKEKLDKIKNFIIYNINNLYAWVNFIIYI
jgi:hypothetical protein